MSYQELVIPGEVDPKFMEHLLSPRNLGTLPDADGYAREVGQCGDSMEVYLKVAEGGISEIRVFPDGCMHTLACASALSELARGLSPDQALEITPEALEAELGGLPEDHKHCARLAVNTLGEALADYWKKHRPPQQPEPPAG